ncbi:MAG: transcriptional regulator [Bifidobacteriaceae bacterium]|jgi:DNA-binding MarR family transcriptional regulator|nr:transcriptional regulator [Bifidobacteriaceae bacterium]
MPVPELDPVIHAASRLRLVAVLATLDAGESIAFTKLQRVAEITQGNLSTHLAKLEAAGYVQIDKTFEGKRPATYARLTGAGRAAFETYQANLNQLLRGAE